MLKRLSEWRGSFSARMVAYSLLFMAVTTILISLLVANQYERTVRERTMETTTVAFATIEKQIEQYMNNARTAGLTIAQDTSAQAYLLDSYKTTLEGVNLFRSLADTVTATFRRFDYIGALAFSRGNGELSGRIGMWVFSQGEPNGYAKSLLPGAAGMPAYSMKWLGVCDAVDFIPIRKTASLVETFGLKMIYGLEPLSFSSGDKSDPLYMLIGIREDGVRGCYSHLAGQDGEVYLLGETGEILSCADGSLIGQTADYHSRIEEGNLPIGGTLRMGDEDYQVIYHRFAQTGWTLVKLVPMTVYYKQTEMLLIRALEITLTVLALVCVCYSLWAHSFTRPLREIAQKLYEIQQNHWNARMRVSSSINEFSLIERQFNDMADAIGELRRKDAESQREKLELELRSLQAQINPHFLYNSIASIRWLAAFNGQTKVADMLVELAESLRPVFTDPATEWSIAEEISFLGHYMKLMELRYGASFRIRNDVGESLMSVPIPRFVVQPLIENACEHGGSGGAVEVELRLTLVKGDIELSVSDDGQGISPEHLAELRAALTENDQTRIRSHRGNGIGLCNINRRLQLSFGEGYGLRIDSAPGEGTTTTIRLRVT